MEPSRLRLGPFLLHRPLLNYLWYSRLPYRDRYNRLRQEGVSAEDAISGARLQPLGKRRLDYKVSDLESHPWHDALEPWRGLTVFFCTGRRNLEYMRPVISAYHERCVIWSDVDCSEEDWGGDSKAVLPFVLSRNYVYGNPYLAADYPDFFAFAHSILLTLSLLRPRTVVCIDGCQTRYMIAAEYCRIAGVRSVCIQQGWPSLIHQGFHDWAYSRFLTWGEGFSSLLKPYNPCTRFISAGYPYEIERGSDAPRQAIGFFLQDRIYLGSEYADCLMRRAISYAAQAYPEVTVYVRRHPLCRKDSERFQIDRQNVVWADDIPLARLFAMCKVAVSQFSSCIIESTFHGCRPIVLDPASGSRYNPDIEAEGLGKICGNFDGFIKSLSEVMHQDSSQSGSNWCDCYGAESVRRICNLISSRE